jgi:hypothetical protein
LKNHNPYIHTEESIDDTKINTISRLPCRITVSFSSCVSNTHQCKHKIKVELDGKTTEYYECGHNIFKLLKNNPGSNININSTNKYHLHIFNSKDKIAFLNLVKDSKIVLIP